MDKNQQVVYNKDPARDWICNLPNNKQAIIQRLAAELLTTCNRKSRNHSIVLLTKSADNQKFSESLNISLQGTEPTHIPAPFRCFFICCVNSRNLQVPLTFGAGIIIFF